MSALSQTQEIDATKFSSRANLWQGSAPPLGPDLARAGFTVLFLMAEEFQPRAASFPGLKAVYHVPIDDGKLETRDLVRVKRAARRAADALRQGERVLVTCWMGRNRSGLLSALALADYLDVSPCNVARVIQRARLGALTNEHFQRYLCGGR